MKTFIKSLLLLPALIAGLGLIPAGRVTAQTFTTLHSFTGGSDGAYPYNESLILSGDTLYGTAGNGGLYYSGGTLFAVNTNGTGFTILHSFTGGGDGAYPAGGLILSGNTLYGMANRGGSSGAGTVFAVNTDGTGFTTLYSFTGGSGGAYPEGHLILSGNTLYGTTSAHQSGYGTVFAVSTDGTGFTTLHNFAGASDGANSYAGLILSGNTLYGTATYGGSSGVGTVFAVNTDGTGFTTLHSFTGSDGANPGAAGLILSGNSLYGPTYGGGSSGVGTVFVINTDGTGFTTLHNFTAGSDGAYPVGGLFLSGTTLYGTANSGGSSGNGTVFAVNTDGTDFTTLHNFTGGSDGANPDGGLNLSGNALYGTAFAGGSSGVGTVFSLSLVTAPPTDTTPPVIACPADIVIGNDPRSCSAVVSFTTTATDDSGNVSVTCSPPSGSLFPNGMTTVTCTATDPSGNISHCSFTVTVNDTEKPHISCPANIGVSTDLGQCSAVVNYPAPTASDNCPSLTVTCNPPSGSNFPKGATTVTCSAIDTAGNTASCSFTVTVNDTEKPHISCPANLTVSCNADLLVPVSFSASATDNCDPDPSVSFTPASGSGFPVGTTTVTCAATDASGNHSYCTFTVTRAPLGFAGFLSPIGGADATGGSFASPVRTFKMGSTIPVKFTASCDGSAVLTGAHRLQAVKYSDSTTAATPIDATPQDPATTGNQFRLADGQWHFNLDTKGTGMSAGIWLLRATLSDGSQHSTWIQIK